MSYFSEETEMLLATWFSNGSEIKEMPPSIRKEIEEKKLTPSRDMKLYRGYDSDLANIKDDKITFPFYSSWTYSFKMAHNFGIDKIMMATFSPSDIFLDSTMLNDKYLEFELGGMPSEMEAIIKPGSYVVSLLDRKYSEAQLNGLA